MDKIAEEQSKIQAILLYMNEAPALQTNQLPATPGSTEQEAPQTGNAYPLFRRFFLIVLVLAVLGTLLFLLYLNGRSLYTYGL